MDRILHVYSSASGTALCINLLSASCFEKLLETSWVAFRFAKSIAPEAMAHAHMTMRMGEWNGGCNVDGGEPHHNQATDDVGLAVER